VHKALLDPTSQMMATTRAINYSKIYEFFRFPKKIGRNGSLGIGWKNDHSTIDCLTFVANNKVEVVGFKLWNTIRPMEFKCTYSIIKQDRVLEHSTVVKQPKDTGVLAEQTTQSQRRHHLVLEKMRNFKLETPVLLTPNEKVGLIIIT
jgi:hypothetical protein